MKQKNQHKSPGIIKSKEKTQQISMGKKYMINDQKTVVEALST